jgi:hypothetical protein
VAGIARRSGDVSKILNGMHDDRPPLAAPAAKKEATMFKKVGGKRKAKPDAAVCVRVCRCVCVCVCVCVCIYIYIGRGAWCAGPERREQNPGWFDTFA